jgi:hypothetical protein
MIDQENTIIPYLEPKGIEELEENVLAMTPLGEALTERLRRRSE